MWPIWNEWKWMKQVKMGFIRLYVPTIVIVQFIIHWYGEKTGNETHNNIHSRFCSLGHPFRVTCFISENDISHLGR